MKMKKSTIELLRYKRKLQGFAQRTNNSTCFKVGHIPHNKGKPTLVGHKTRFKKGKQHTGENHPSWLGGIQVREKDCVCIWVGNNKRVRRPKLVWEKHNGKLKKGLIIFHKDGNKYNDNIDNLEAITRAELMKRNEKKRRFLKGG